MQEKMVGAVAGLRSGHHIDDPGVRINHRRAGDANFRIDVEIRTVARIRVPTDDANVLAWYRRAQVYVPQGQSLGGIIGIERVNAVVLGCDIHDVARLSADGKIWHIQGLGVNLTVHGAPKQFSKTAHVHARRVEGALVEVLTGACRVVMLGEDRDLSDARYSGEQTKKFEQQGESEFAQHVPPL